MPVLNRGSAEIKIASDKATNHQSKDSSKPGCSWTQARKTSDLGKISLPSKHKALRQHSKDSVSSAARQSRSILPNTKLGMSSKSDASTDVATSPVATTSPSQASSWSSRASVASSVS